MFALHQKANPEFTRAKEIKALDFIGPVHQKPSTGTRVIVLCAVHGPGNASPAKETFLQKNFLCLQKPLTMSHRPESKATIPGTHKPRVEHELPSPRLMYPESHLLLAEVGW